MHYASISLIYNAPNETLVLRLGRSVVFFVKTYPRALSCLDKQQLKKRDGLVATSGLCNYIQFVNISQLCKYCEFNKTFPHTVD